MLYFRPIALGLLLRLSPLSSEWRNEESGCAMALTLRQYTVISVLSILLWRKIPLAKCLFIKSKTGTSNLPTASSLYFEPFQESSEPESVYSAAVPDHRDRAHFVQCGGFKKVSRSNFDSGITW